MKTINLLLAFCLSLFISCEESTGPWYNHTWILQKDMNDGITYYSIYFSDRNTGWICGYDGTIKKTIDGGKTWQLQQSGVSSNLWDISFVDGLHGWICGTGNTLLKTTDGGESWIKIFPHGDGNRIFVEIKFTDINNGWLSSNGGEILRTTDGGEFWSVKKSGLIGGSRLSVINSNTVYALSGKLYKTSNGGEDWDSVSIPLTKDNLPAGIFFCGENNGWIVMQNLTSSRIINEVPVLITGDGGNTWSQSEFLVDGDTRCIYFVNKSVGWTAGMLNIYQSVDGGKHWTPEYTPRGGLYSKDICFVDENNGWLISYYGVIYKYTNMP